MDPAPSSPSAQPALFSEGGATYIRSRNPRQKERVINRRPRPGDCRQRVGVFCLSYQLGDGPVAAAVRVGEESTLRSEQLVEPLANCDYVLEGFREGVRQAEGAAQW